LDGSSTTGCTPKKGSAALPGLSLHQRPGSGLIIAVPVSVCHHVSTIGARLSPTTCAAASTQEGGGQACIQQAVRHDHVLH
jgi:hypothetical protein